MSVAEVTAERWTCDGCGVSVSWIDGHREALPESWARSADGRFCLKCRRDQAAESAVDAAPDDCNRDARAKLRRASLLEFEIRRAPDRPDNAIARACRSSAVAVAAARRRVRAQSQGPAGDA